MVGRRCRAEGALFELRLHRRLELGQEELVRGRLEYSDDARPGAADRIYEHGGGDRLGPDPEVDQHHLLILQRAVE